MADASSVLVYIGHRDLTHFARVGRIRIDDVLNDAPNTAALSVVLTPKLAPSFTGPFAAPAFDAGAFNTADGPLVMTTPTVAVGAPVGIFLNGGADQIFGGEVLTREQSAEYDRPLASHVRLDLNCTDFTRRLNYRKVSKDYGTQSATAIVLDMIASFAPTIGTAAVQAGLPGTLGRDYVHVRGCLARALEDRREDRGVLVHRLPGDAALFHRDGSRRVARAARARGPLRGLQSHHGPVASPNADPRRGRRGDGRAHAARGGRDSAGQSNRPVWRVGRAGDARGRARRVYRANRDGPESEHDRARVGGSSAGPPPTAPTPRPSRSRPPRVSADSQAGRTRTP